MYQKNFFKNYITLYTKLINNLDTDKVGLLLKLIKSIKKKNKILIFGNGAGASIASHVASDFTNHSKIRAFSFDNSAQLTCYANDYKFENWVKTFLIYAQ